VRLAPGLYQYDDGDARIIIAEVEARGGSLYGLVECWWQGKPIHWGRYDLQGPRTPGSMVKGCLEAAPKGPWAAMCPAVVWDVVHDHLAGDPPVRLRGSPTQPDPWLLDGIVGGVGATSLIGYGESGKSMLALAVALTVSTGRAGFLGVGPRLQGPTLYLDWEADQQTIDHRIGQLCASLHQPPPNDLLYRQERLPLWRSVTALTRHIATEGVRLLIVDSVMLARGGEQSAFSPESTLQLYAALRALGPPALLVDHRTKHGNDPGPYGSVANLNSLRLAWGVTTTAYRTSTAMRLRCIKANNLRRPDDQAWELEFFDDDTRARFTPRAANTILAGEDLSLGERIYGLLLEAGLVGMTTTQLAAELGAGDGTVRKALARLDGRVCKRDGRWMAVVEDRQEVF